MSVSDGDDDHLVPNSRRYPRVIAPTEIEQLPTLEYSPGIVTTIFITRERDDARYFRQGFCTIEIEAEPYEWHGTNFDESQFCLEGLIRVEVRDAEGTSVTLEAGPGEHMLLPAGYHYRWVPTGLHTTMLWTSGPSAPRGLSARAYGDQLMAARRGVGGVQ